MALRALITGFEPTWGLKKSPSGELAKVWQSGAMSVPGTEVRALVLPQKFGVDAEIVCTEIEAFRPHAVLMFGATMHNDPVRLERFAVNCEKTVMGDNTRVPVADRPVIPGGPPAYEPTLPVHLLVEKLKADHVDAKASYHMGTHTCNSLLYRVMHWLREREQPHFVAAGFVHVSFPNEFGVIEDELWATAAFPGIVRASKVLLGETAVWYASEFGTPA